MPIRLVQDSSGRGLTAIISCRRSGFATAALIGPPSGRQASSWTTRPSMPPATVTTWPVTWPESSSEASTTTCARDVLGLRDLPQRHRARDASTSPASSVPARHRRLRPARRDRVHARARRDADDLVLQARGAGRPAMRRLRRGVVGVAGLAEAAGGRADEHEDAVAGALDLAQEAARGEERRRQVRAQRLLPALERELPDGHVLRRPDAGDRRADVQSRALAASRRAASTSASTRQVGAERRARRRAPPRAPRPARGRGGSGRRTSRPRPRRRARRRAPMPPEAPGDEDALALRARSPRRA